jgi:hypothetical protein
LRTAVAVPVTATYCSVLRLIFSPARVSQESTFFSSAAVGPKAVFCCAAVR